jgi:hypothetical protein
VTTAAPSGEFLHIVVGYDGSPPATRALDAAVRLLRGRAGRIEVVWVAHLSSTVMMSAGAVAEMEESFDELAPEMHDQAADQPNAPDRIDRRSYAPDRTVSHGCRVHVVPSSRPLSLLRSCVGVLSPAAVSVVP